jgi:hypothetical protein
MNTIVLTRAQVRELLYYETGFTQLHPNPEIYDWMVEQGYTYNVDWHVDHTPSIDYSEMPYYTIVFNDEKIMTAFVLRWL